MSDDFMSPLALACEKGHLGMAKQLWRYGAPIESKMGTHILPLHAAIRGGVICSSDETAVMVVERRYGPYSAREWL